MLSRGREPPRRADREGRRLLRARRGPPWRGHAVPDRVLGLLPRAADRDPGRGHRDPGRARELARTSSGRLAREPDRRPRRSLQRARPGRPVPDLCGTPGGVSVARSADPDAREFAADRPVLSSELHAHDPGCGLHPRPGDAVGAGARRRSSRAPQRRACRRHAHRPRDPARNHVDCASSWTRLLSLTNR
ncbi:MAG: hypothetical protein JWP01_2178 [Myxococcales bacterium]|nr:hypothetical protein [Myxococcales bacterium]